MQTFTHSAMHTVMYYFQNIFAPESTSIGVLRYIFFFSQRTLFYLTLFCVCMYVQVLSRALEMGAKLRNDPIHTLKRLDDIYFAKSDEQTDKATSHGSPHSRYDRLYFVFCYCFRFLYIYFPKRKGGLLPKQRKAKGSKKVVEIPKPRVLLMVVVAAAAEIPTRIRNL